MSLPGTPARPQRRSASSASNVLANVTTTLRRPRISPIAQTSSRAMAATALTARSTSSSVV